MKLSNITLASESLSSEITFDFNDISRASPYIVKSILGLDASDIVSQYTSTATSGGFYNMTLNSRVIVIKTGLNPSFADGTAYSDLRDTIYKLIASSRSGKVVLLLNDDSGVVGVLYGTITKFEVPHFDKTQDVTITVTCSDPMITGLTQTIIPGTGLTTNSAIITDSMSTAPHGFSFELNILDYCYDIKLVDPTDSSWTFRFGFNPTTNRSSGGFIPNDVVHFYSGYGKHIYVTNIADGAGQTIMNVADSIVPGSVWPILYPGDNQFKVYVRDSKGLMLDAASKVQWSSVSYYPTYWGV